MKRDFDLIRYLLLVVENHQDSKPIDSDTIQVEGYSDVQIGLHLNMMGDAGFIVMEPWKSTTNDERIIKVPLIFDLTWKGHEYLDTIRDPKIWKATKSLTSKIGSASFELVLEIAKALAKDALSKFGLSVGT